MERCRRSPSYLCNSWLFTYDPRLAPQQTYVPFDLWPRQDELLDFFAARVAAREEGLVEKSRDQGFTWLAAAFAWHRWRFVPGFKTTFASRKAAYVDKIGDPDCIFEKIRILYRGLPVWFWPDGFSEPQHDNFMRLINPETGNSINGEAGNDIGRGGRSTLLLVDEAAHLENGDSVDQASSATSDCRIWGSSVMGMGNMFARKRFGGAMRPEQIFRLHYSQDPRKTTEWIRKKRSSMEDHKWAAEYEIDYSASVEGICIPARWIEASIALRALVLDRVEIPARGVAGLDVGAGKAKSVWCPRWGSLVGAPQSRGDPDTAETAHWALDLCQNASHARAAGQPAATIGALHYDSVGVGINTQNALKHRDAKGVRVVPTNVGNPPSETIWPDGETSELKFGNLKAECWWLTRARLKATYELYQHLTGAVDNDGKPAGHEHPLSEVLLLPPPSLGPDAQALAAQLALPRWFRNEKGKIVIETKVQLAARGLPSPDHAEALILAMAPVKQPLYITQHALARAAGERRR